MPPRKRKKRETPPAVVEDRGSRPRWAILVAAGIACLAIAAAAFQAVRLFQSETREIVDEVLPGPGIQLDLEAWASLEDAPLADDGPAAEFQSELYGIVEPLVEKLPKSTRARCLLASTHRRFARSGIAVRELQRCLTLDPTCAEAHYILGLIAMELPDYPLAELHLRVAFDSDPRWANVPLQLAKAQISQDKNHEAVLTLEAYLELVPGDAEAWCNLGQAYQKLGEFDRAKRCHLAAIELLPGLDEAQYGVAIALRELGAAEESKEYFETFRQLRSSTTVNARSRNATATDEDFVRTAIADTATKAGAVYAMHEHLAEAETCWTKATTLDPTLTECQEMLCRLRPEDPERWLGLGHAYLQSGRPMDAKAPFEQAMELAPQDARGYAASAQVYLLLDESAKESLELARTAVQLEATAPNYFLLATACERLKDWPGAKMALEHAIRLDPADKRYSEAFDKLTEEQRP